MKSKMDSQKGFTALIIIIFVLAILVIGGLSFYFYQQSQRPIISTQLTKTQEGTSAGQTSPKQPSLGEEVQGINIDDGSADFSQLDQDLQNL